MLKLHEAEFVRISDFNKKGKQRLNDFVKMSKQRPIEFSRRNVTE